MTGESPDEVQQTSQKAGKEKETGIKIAVIILYNFFNVYGFHTHSRAKKAHVLFTLLWVEL